MDSSTTNNGRFGALDMSDFKMASAEAPRHRIVGRKFRIAFFTVRGSHKNQLRGSECFEFARRHGQGDSGEASAWDHIQNALAWFHLESGTVPKHGVCIVSRFRIQRTRWLFLRRTYPVLVMSYIPRQRPQSTSATATDIIVGGL